MPRHAIRRALALAVLAAAIPASASAATGAITTIPLPSTTTAATFVTKGPDGAVWFVETGMNLVDNGTNTMTKEIGRVDDAGHVTEFNGGFHANIAGITAGPLGHVWWTDNQNNVLGELDPATGTYTPHGGLGITNEKDLVAGPDGNLYVLGSDSVTQITVPGFVATTFPIKGMNAQSIIVGPDGNLWWTELNTDSIGELDIHQTTPVVHQFLLPTGAQPRGIIAGTDGNVWFTETGAAFETVAHISTAGNNYVQYDKLTGGLTDPEGLAIGADGNMWFVTHNGGGIVMASASTPVLTQFTAGVTTVKTPLRLAADSSGNLFVTDDMNDALERVEVDKPAPPPVVTPPPPPPPAPAPVTLSKLSLTRTSFRAGTPSKAHPTLGTTIRFTLSRAAKVTISFAKLTTGRKVGGTCVTATKARRHHPTCQRSTSVGSKSVTGAAGANIVSFSGKLTHTLTPGRYRLTLTAKTADGQVAKALTATFTVLAPPAKHTTKSTHH